MSATIETTTSFWRKRHREEDNSPSHMDRKRLRYYYRLESESSKASEDDTESVYSLQGRETDIVKDTSDTDTNNLDVSEYEVESLSENEFWGEHSNSSSGTENMTLGHLVAAAEAMYDTSMEKWITDCEESDNSSLDDSAISRSDFSTCTQCKSLNLNPQFRYCEKCYQSCRQCKMRKTYKGFPLCLSCHKDRKKFFPPRPRGNRKARNLKKITEPAVKLENLRSALSGLSQDSGIGSSQEMPSSLPSSDEIVVREEHLDTGISEDMIPSSSSLASSASMISGKSTDEQAKSTVSVSSTDMSFSKRIRKRYLSESSLSDLDIKRPKIDEKKTLSQVSDFDSEISASSYSSSQPNKGKPPINKDDSLDTARSSTDSVGYDF